MEWGVEAGERVGKAGQKNSHVHPLPNPLTSESYTGQGLTGLFCTKHSTLHLKFWKPDGDTGMILFHQSKAVSEKKKDFKHAPKKVTI